MLPLALNDTDIPKSLRELPRWFATASQEAPGHVARAHYSAVTLELLHWDERSDFTDLGTVTRAMEECPWLDGVALKIMKPYLALIIQNALGPEGKVPKWLRFAATRIGGYWERTTRGGRQDVLGILKCDVFPASEFGMYYGKNVFYCTDGLCRVSGRTISGLAGDPESTNLTELLHFYWRFKGPLENPIFHRRV